MTNTATATEGFTFFRGEQVVWVDADDIGIDPQTDSRYIARNEGKVVAYFTRDYSVVKGRNVIT
ncbi:MAG: hypothetical protein V3T23_00025 [Nitrososphaerales archaeon]